MNTLRFTLTAITLSALLAGCGGAGMTASVPPGGTQSVGHHATSSSGDLLYVNDGGVDGCCAYVLVYTYPEGKHVTTLGGFGRLTGACSDAKGNVFIISPNVLTYAGSVIYEYAHGGSTPIATLSESGEAVGCAVDPTTGNVAVANGGDVSNPYGKDWGSIAIFQQATGAPTMYYSSTAQYFYYCGYDSVGTLYITTAVAGGFVLDRLSAGSIDTIKMKTPLDYATYFVPSVQWDGKEMAVSSTLSDVRTEEYTGPVNVYRLRISGRKATVIGTTRLTAPQKRQRGQTWIQGNTIIGVAYDHGHPEVSFWSFPKGGKPYRQIRRKQYPPGSTMDGVTVSVAPSRTRVHKQKQSR
jgi:hypothetical protein